MPFALIFLAVLLIVAGFRGTQSCLFTLLRADAGGQFWKWLAAVGIVGGIGYIKPLETVSTALLVLLLVVLFLANGGVFTKFAEAFSGGLGGGTANVVQPTSSNTLPSFAALQSGQTLLQATGIGSLPSMPAGGTGGLY